MKPLVRVKLSLVKIAYSLGNGIIGFLQTNLFDLLKEKVYKKIIIFRTGSIGDTVCAMPALNAILTNFPDAEIDLLTNAGGDGKISPVQFIDVDKFNKVVDYSTMSKLQLHSYLKKSNYDLFIELPQYDISFVRLLRNMLFVKSTGIKSAFGWKYSSNFYFSGIQEKYLKFDNERDRLKNILRVNGIKVDEKDYFLYSTSKPEDIKNKLLSIGIENTNNMIAIVIGANRENNKWPIERFYEVAQYFSNKGYTIFAIGGPQEKDLGEELKKIDNYHNLCGFLSPLESLACIRLCKLVISNDTGPMHLSYSSNVPTIALFNARDYSNKWFPPLGEGYNNFVFRAEGMDTSLECMKKIKVEDVIKRAEEMLGITQVDSF